MFNLGKRIFMEVGSGRIKENLRMVRVGNVMGLG